MARTSATAGGTQLFSVVVSPGTGTTTPPGPGTTPPPGHTAVVPENVRTDLPKISNGEIFDIVVVGDRVFIAGSFTSIQNQRPGNTTSYAQAGLASYDLTTGLVDASFRPNFGGEEVDSVAVTPDGTKLYVAGTFSTINGVTRRGLARLDLTTGAPVTGFVADTNARSTEVVASNTTVYVGGRFVTVNGTSRGSLAAVDANTGQVDGSFVNNITQGIGVNGAIGVQRLVLTHDTRKLIVVHTGRQVNGQDRAGVAIIDTVTKQLLPWHSTLWEDNLEFVGGIQRAYGAAVSPDDSYFVVTSGSGGDRPPINDTAIAFNLTGGDNVQPLWISRLFDSVYSVAISENAVYVGGHFAWNESPTANDPWPGQADIGYGTGQGLSAYALGDQVVNREHLGALDPVTGKALEWHPGSDSYEGNKAMLVTSRGLITGGDANIQGGQSIGRIAFFDFNSVPAGNGVDTAITEPIMGRVVNSGEEFEVKGTSSATGGVNRVEVAIQNAANGQYLQDNLTTFSNTSNTIDATLGAGNVTWTLPLTIPGNVKLQATARTFATGGASDPSPAVKKFETFNLDDAPPTVSYTAPAAGTVPTKTFTITGTTADDKGVVGLSLTIRNENNRYLQDDGTVATAYNSFGIAPDVPGATSTTWQKEVTVPDEGLWKAQIRANDTGGQSSLDTSDRTWIVSATAQTPVVSITSPSTVTPPTIPQTFTVAPGQPITFTGSATDDGTIKSIDIALVNNSTQEYLTTNGSFGRNNGLNVYRLMGGLDQKTVNWTYTTPYDLTPGSYQFAVLATDNDDLTTPSTLWAVAAFNAQVAGDTPPKATLSPTGLQPPLTSLSLPLSGTATDATGVTEVRVSLRDADTAKYAAPGGGTQATYTYFTVPVTSGPGEVKSWSTTIPLPTEGDWSVTAVAVDTAGQYDFSNTGATARYLAYPTDTPPTFNMNLLAPSEGATFGDGKICVSGRAEDDQAMAKVEVQVQNAANPAQYMTSSGSVTTTPTWVSTLLTSPGTPGSNFSYTTPIVPPGSYTVRVRGTDQHDLVTTAPPARTVTVTHPANTKPVAVIDPVVCTNNVCQFDGKHSTDEAANTLTYAWNFGNNGAVPPSTPVSGGSATGPNPRKTFTAAGTYTVTLTVKDQWGLPSDAVTTQVTITEPPGNAAPTPVINAPSCNGLTCNFSAVGTVDPNTGDTIAYSWDFGDPGSGVNNLRTGSATSHAFTAATTYTVTLTATDGWGKSALITREVTVTAPPTP
ncbi:MAG: PKD domain-containing protein [Marmoricola sp.]